MDKAQALQSFWASFGLTAYDELTVPDDAQAPYITYETNLDGLPNSLSLTGSVWYRSTTWSAVEAKVKQIEDFIGYGGTVIQYTDGALWIKKRLPFAQRIADPNDDMIRRYYINIEADFLSA